MALRARSIASGTPPMCPFGSRTSLSYPSIAKLSVSSNAQKGDAFKVRLTCTFYVEEIGVDGQIIDHITEVDLQQDFDIKVRLHRVKIIEGIKKLQQKENARKTPPSSELLAKSMSAEQSNQH